MGRRRGKVLDRGQRESNRRPLRQLSAERRRALRCHLDLRARDEDRASREQGRIPGWVFGGWRTGIFEGQVAVCKGPLRTFLESAGEES